METFFLITGSVITLFIILLPLYLMQGGDYRTVMQDKINRI